MKVVLFNGSPRKKGNTFHCLRVVQEELESNGIECELVWIGAEKLNGCLACLRCSETLDKKCNQTEDKMNEYIAKMINSDGIILGSPTYFSDVSTNIKE